MPSDCSIMSRIRMRLRLNLLFTNCGYSEDFLRYWMTCEGFYLFHCHWRHPARTIGHHHLLFSFFSCRTKGQAGYQIKARIQCLKLPQWSFRLMTISSFRENSRFQDSQAIRQYLSNLCAFFLQVFREEVEWTVVGAELDHCQMSYHHNWSRTTQVKK